jgi:hypothetical protein
MNYKVKLLSTGMYLVMMLLAGSCGDSLDNDTANVRLKMKATSDLGTINSNGRVLETDINFLEFLVGVTKVELEFSYSEYEDDENEGYHDDDDKDDDGEYEDNWYEDEYEIEFEGKFVVDLLNGSSSPDFGITNVIPGVYEELEIEIAPIMDDGNSIFVKFEYSLDGSEPVIVEFSSDKTFEIEIENEYGFEIDGGMLNQLLVLVDLDELIASLDLSGAMVDDDGVIRINEDSNEDIAAMLVTKLHDAMEAGEDMDGDDDFHDDDDYFEDEDCDDDHDDKDDD